MLTSQDLAARERSSRISRTRFICSRIRESRRGFERRDCARVLPICERVSARTYDAGAPKPNPPAGSTMTSVAVIVEPVVEPITRTLSPLATALDVAEVRPLR